MREQVSDDEGRYYRKEKGGGQNLPIMRHMRRNTTPKPLQKH